MDSLKQRIVDYVGANQPVKRADLIVVIGISGKGLDREPNPRSSMERQRNAQCSIRCGVTQFPLAG